MTRTNEALVSSVRQSIFLEPRDETHWRALSDCLLDQGDPRWEAVMLRHACLFGQPTSQQVNRVNQLAAQGVHCPSALSPEGIDMVYLPAGSFWMGSRAKSEKVEIPTPFFLGVYLVTQNQWIKVMDKNPSHFQSNDHCHDHPVEFVSWANVNEFIIKLNKVSSSYQYRLPIEAEWEYACKSPAGSLTRNITKKQCSWSFFLETGGTSDLSPHQANFNGQYPAGSACPGPYLRLTTPVGSYRPNANGLYDMHGNVFEWCQDLYDHLRSGHVCRGGCWFTDGVSCRSYYRHWLEPYGRSPGVGFRLAASLVRDG